MSDEFDTILDRCLADLAAGRATIDSCLRRYPAQADQLAWLLPLAERARAVPPPAPLPMDKRRALESRLLKRAGELAAQSASRPVAPRLSVWQRRGVFAAMSLVLSVLLLFSTVSVSAASLPGDVLYPIKRAAEQVRIALTPDQAQAAVHLELAQVRLHELDVLAQRGEVSAELSAEVEVETNIVLERVALLPPEQQQALLTQLTSFQDGQLLVLGKMAALAKGAKLAEVEAALTIATAKRQQVMGLIMRNGGPANDPTQNQGKKPQATDVEGGTESSPGKAATNKPTSKPAATDKPTAEPKETKEPKSEETPKPTKVHPPTPVKPTPRVEITPTEQTSGSTPNSPPGQGNKPTKAPKK